MCIIVDTNTFHKFKNSTDEDMEPVSARHRDLAQPHNAPLRRHPRPWCNPFDMRFHINNRRSA